ncbi:MAG: hypothetical protein KAX30_01415, partial [Candidatus Atribacteria bacterium]|nr:hypothetical protein [Candidatus Atribacteria bacterium]
MINTIILGNALIELPKLPSGIANCVVTSPPYWGLRDYGVEPVIWDGDKNCKHEWGNPINRKMTGGKESAGTGTHKSGVGHFNNNSNFCLKCGAWRGSLGLEPTFELYIKHLCDIFDEVKRVLRRDGTCWVNIGDTYNSHSAKSKNVGGFEGKQMRNNKAYSDSKIALKKVGVPDKSLCDIPYRFSIEMINRGWIKRNTLIWHKPNCMPSSANDRFTIDFEYLFFFTKNNKAIFWTNEKTLECVSKKPLGTKGIEGKDWEWRETQNWKEEENAGYEIGATDPHRAASIGGLKLGAKHKKSGKLKKVSLWTGHDYWFKQQFE